MKPRVVIFGLDGGAFSVLDDLVRRGVMPYLGEFMSRGARAPLMSTVPPLTPPAWTTLFTGRSPGNHGITNFLQFESAESKYIRVITSREVRTPTLMALLSQAGLRTGCLNLIAHNPPPKYNGYVVPGWVTFRWIKKYSHPEGFLDRVGAAVPDLDIKDLGMDFSEERKAIQGAALSDYEPWINMHIRRERQWFSILRHQMINEPCDFEAVVFDGVDKLQHLCWPYIDPALAPANPDEAFLRIQRRCWDYFRQIDDFLKETVELAGPDAHVLVVSDHGFTGSDEVVYINTWLEQQGYLTWSDTTVVQTDESAELGRARPYHLTFFDLEKTQAYAVLASTNGINIQVRGQKGPHGIAPEDYESFRSELIDALLTRCVDPVTSDPIVKRVWTREEAFSGSAMDLAPDLTLELRDFGFFSVLRGASVLKKRPVVMGTHHPSGVFAACGPGIRAGARLDAMDLLDVAPTVLHLLDQPIPDDLEGRMTEEAFTEEFLRERKVQHSTAARQVPAPAQTETDEGYQDAESQEQIMMRLKALGYIEQGVSMAKALLNGINVHYQVKGEGPDVVMLHGVTSSLAIWYAKVMPDLGKNFRVTAYDLRGHGYSDPTPTGYTSRAMADDLLALLDHLKIEKARLVGHSFGGSIALHLAMLHPERVEGVVLGDTGVACLRYLRTIQDWPGWETYKDRITKYGISYDWFVEAEATDVRNVIRKSYDMKQPYGARKGGLVGTPRLRKLIEETNIAAEFREVAGLTEELLPSIKTPVLAVYGETSPYQKMAARLTEIMPNCRAVLIPGTGHFYLLENVDLFIDTISPFLADPAGDVASRPAITLSEAPDRLDPRLALATNGNGTVHAQAAPTHSPKKQEEIQPQARPSGGKEMSRILLVSPKFDSEFAKARQMAKVDVNGDAIQSLMIPLHLATIAALTPPEFQVDIWDEGARGEIDDATDLGHKYDLVGVTGYIAHIPRAVAIANVIRRRGIPVVIGGPGVSGSPELCRGVFDVLFLGEAEITWPRFLQEWKQGTHRNEYRQVERPDLSNSPQPRWDSVAADIQRYRLAGVQTTRGCPYDCEFCDVIHLFGRQPRHKPVARVVDEVLTLQKLGAQRIFICDDDFIGDKKYAKELLRALIPVNNSFDPPLTFSTQLTIDLAHDEELMELMADCNFTQALIGIETPRTASLEETNKIQNLRGDLVEDCRKIHSYGIAVKAALIVGFDNDDTKVFDEQIRFVEDAHIPITSINTMKAYPGTPLWVRLQRDNRVVDVEDIYDDSPKVVTNIIPKGMTRVELLEGYLRLITEVRSWSSFAKRMKAFISGITRKAKVAPPSPAVRAQRMDKLGKAREALNWLPEDARNAVTELIMHTMQHAPHMIEHVGVLTMQHAMDHALLPYHAEIVQKQIEKTKSGNLKLAPDPSAGMIPEGFQSALRGVMPVMFDRFAAEMHHQPDVPEAIVALLKDFLIRWGPTFQQFEDYHMVYVHELCDRHVQRFNGNNGSVKNSNGNGHEHNGHNGRGLKREQVQSAKFLSAVLVAVEQEMRGQVRSKVSVDSIPLTIRSAVAAPA